MEHLGQRYAHRRAVGVGLHDVRHIVPPLAHHRVLRQLVRRAGVRQFLHGEQGQRFRVQKDRVVGDARLAQRARQLRPDLVVPPLVFGLTAGFQLHLERDALHNFSFPYRDLLGVAK